MGTEYVLVEAHTWMGRGKRCVPWEDASEKYSKRQEDATALGTVTGNYHFIGQSVKSQFHTVPQNTLQ